MQLKSAPQFSEVLPIIVYVVKRCRNYSRFVWGKSYGIYFILEAGEQASYVSSGGQDARATRGCFTTELLPGSFLVIYGIVWRIKGLLTV